MRKGPILFLQIVIVFLGLATLVFLALEPQFEGVNANATKFEIYFNDPFLVITYLGSTAFFTALYQTFKLLGNIRQNKVFSENSVRALRIIKFCALVIIGFVALGIAHSFIFVRGTDDIAGGVAIGTFIGFVSIVVSIVADIFEGILQKGIARNIDLS